MPKASLKPSSIKELKRLTNGSNRRCPLCRLPVKANIKLILDPSDIILTCGTCLNNHHGPRKETNASETGQASETIHEPTQVTIVSSDDEDDYGSQGSREGDYEYLQDHLDELRLERAQLISRVDSLMASLTNLRANHEREMEERHVRWLHEQAAQEKELLELRVKLSWAEAAGQRAEAERERFRAILREVTADRDALQTEIHSLRTLRVARELQRVLFETEATGEEEAMIRSLSTLGPEAILDALRQYTRLSRQAQRDREELDRRMQAGQVERESLKHKFSKLQDKYQALALEREELAVQLAALKEKMVKKPAEPQIVSKLAIEENLPDHNVVPRVIPKPNLIQLPSKIANQAKRTAGQMPDGSGGSSKIFFTRPKQ